MELFGLVLTTHLNLKNVVSETLEILEFEIAPSTMCTNAIEQKHPSLKLLYLPHGPVQYDSIERL